MKKEKEKQKVIELMDGYVCLVDRLSWTPAKRVGVGKDGSPRYKYCGYFSGLSGVLKQLGKEIIVERLPDGSPAISEALRTISESNNRLVKFIEDNFPDYEIKKKGE